MPRIIDDPHERLWAADELKHNQPEVNEADLAEWLAARNFPAGIIIDIEGRTYMSYPLQDDQYDCIILKECEFEGGTWLLLEDGRALFPSFANDRKAQQAERELLATVSPDGEIQALIDGQPLGSYQLRQYGKMALFEV